MAKVNKEAISRIAATTAVQNVQQLVSRLRVLQIPEKDIQEEVRNFWKNRGNAAKTAAKG